jgi:phage/plasmid-associated DNA primase
MVVLVQSTMRTKERARASRLGAMGWLHGVFGDNITSLLWALGDMLYDSSNKRLFILYGPGGVGKSVYQTGST